MKKEVKMFTVECDICGKEYIDEDSGFCAWNEFEYALDSAIEGDNWIKNHNVEDKHYCSDCYEINDNDEVLNKKTKEILFIN